MLARIISPTRSFASIWAGVPQGPPDPILGLSEAFQADKDPKKVNLGVGAYRDNNGKPWVLPSVRKAEELIFNGNVNHEYLPISGLKEMLAPALKVAYGNTAGDNLAATQCLSGTGGLRVGFEFCARWLGKSTQVYIPKPTWPNHKNVIRDSGLEWKEFRWYNPETKAFDLKGLTEDLKKAPKGSIILLHACAHNPTGADPTKQDWENILDLAKTQAFPIFFDSAYQGFASGDLDQDAWPFRRFVQAGVPIVLAQSFAKNFGLYGQRVGVFSIVCANPEEKKKVQSQLQIVVRPMYSNPPIYGAKIVSTVLNNPELTKMWHGELRTMSGRIKEMRTSLVKNLKDIGSKHDWSHVVNQIGMFAYTGLSAEKCKDLQQNHHIYLTLDGRISIAGLNTKNVAQVADAFHKVTKDLPKI